MKKYIWRRIRKEDLKVKMPICLPDRSMLHSLPLSQPFFHSFAPFSTYFHLLYPHLHFYFLPLAHIFDPPLLQLWFTVVSLHLPIDNTLSPDIKLYLTWDWKISKILSDANWEAVAGLAAGGVENNNWAAAPPLTSAWTAIPSYFSRPKGWARL